MPDEVTIGELADQVGMSVRNVRAHQARGLLPPPRLVGRVGYYHAGHRRRLERIQVLQAEGLNLAAIERIFAEEQERLASASSDLYAPFQPTELALGDYLDEMGVGLDHPTVRRALAVGLLEVDGDSVRLLGPGLRDVGVDLAAFGVPRVAQLAVLIEVREAARQIADAYMDLSDRHVFRLLLERCGDDADALRAALELLAGRARQAAAAAVDQAIGQALDARFSGPDPSEP